MAVTAADVLHVARLARLALSDTEVQTYAEQLNAILAHAQELEAVDVSAVECFSIAVDWPAPLREDVVGPDPLAFPAAALSKAARDGFFTVPRLAAMQKGDGES